MIEITNGFKSYDGEKSYILNNVSITINEGDLIGIVGTSGSGKTTLLNILGTLDKLSSGRYVFDNTNIDRLNDQALTEFRNKHIGFVFQEYMLIPYLSALENITLPVLHLDKQTQKNYFDKANSLIDKFGIQSLKNKKTKNLSGGEKQRVSLARALIQNPGLILADEPTGNLDEDNAKLVIKELYRISKEEKVTVVIVTHDKSMLPICDKVYEIKSGRLNQL
ncbi:MAG: ABC transporter ATP-binding protein [Acholeplasma sp.]|nr:ABC transporter ATP-binding protein [Acholeplasma sp.]